MKKLQKCLTHSQSQYLVDLDNCKSKFDESVLSAQNKLSDSIARAIAEFVEDVRACSHNNLRERLRCIDERIENFKREIFLAQVEYEHQLRICDIEYAQSRSVAQRSLRKDLRECIERNL